MKLEIQFSKYIVALCPGKVSGDAATAKNNDDNCYDNEGGIAFLFGFIFNNGGHLFFHDFFSF